MDTKIKKLIYDARGPHRNMQQFAADIGMSPAKLYRIAEGGFRKPVSDDDLEAIAEHADKESGITFGQLKVAVMQDEAARHQEENDVSKDRFQYWEISAKRAVMEALYANNIPFVNAEQHGNFFDFCMAAQIGDFKQTLYFDVKHYAEPYNIQSFLERSIGGYVLNGNEDGWHYVVFIGEPEERNGNRPTFQEHYIEHLRDRHTSLNVSVLFIDERIDGSYVIKEVCLKPEAQIVSFDYIT